MIPQEKREGRVVVVPAEAPLQDESFYRDLVFNDSSIVDNDLFPLQIEYPIPFRGGRVDVAFYKKREIHLVEVKICYDDSLKDYKNQGLQQLTRYVKKTDKFIKTLEIPLDVYGTLVIFCAEQKQLTKLTVSPPKDEHKEIVFDYCKYADAMMTYIPNEILDIPEVLDIESFSRFFIRALPEKGIGVEKDEKQLLAKKRADEYILWMITQLWGEKQENLTKLYVAYKLREKKEEEVS